MSSLHVLSLVLGRYHITCHRDSVPWGVLTGSFSELNTKQTWQLDGLNNSFSWYRQRIFQLFVDHRGFQWNITVFQHRFKIVCVVLITFLKKWYSKWKSLCYCQMADWVFSTSINVIGGEYIRQAIKEDTGLLNEQACIKHYLLIISRFYNLTVMVIHTFLI